MLTDRETKARGCRVQTSLSTCSVTNKHVQLGCPEECPSCIGATETAIHWSCANFSSYSMHDIKTLLKLEDVFDLPLPISEESAERWACLCIRTVLPLNICLCSHK